MSKKDLLTVEEARTAAAQGWGVYDVYDQTSGKWRVMVLGLSSAEASFRAVFAQAKAGSVVAQKALRLVAAGATRTSKKGKK